MVLNYRKKYEVVVAGAGIAGVAAALAAARRGHKVALVEKQTLIGGLATAGLIYVYLPLCDGNGTQVTFGIAEELLNRSLKYSPFDLPEAWGGRKNGNYGCGRIRYMCRFSPAGFTLALEEALKEAGVDLWLDTLICASQTASDRTVTGLEVENVSGRGLLEAGCFVDATGDATVIRRAGGAFETSENYRTPWIMESAPDTTLYPVVDSIHIQCLGEWSKEFEVENALDSRTVTDFTRGSWAMARKAYDDAYASGKCDRYHNFPIHLPAMPQFRKIARIKGIETLRSGQEWTSFDSSVGLCADWRKAGPVWETPFGTLVPEDVRGVFAAGRCTGTDGDAWEIFRVIPAAAMTGEIAGTAASLAVEKKLDGVELDVDSVRSELRKNGFKFHFEELGLRRGNATLGATP